jgi:hypothetical protein
VFERFDRPVRCRRGHLFTTIWMPMGSFKAIRWSGERVQHCPVGHHWGVVVPLDVSTASQSQLDEAAAVHDFPIP